MINSNNLKKIKTADGSFTFFNEQVGDTYHSITVGALDEARVKYVEPVNVKEGDVILDFCFGLGYNSLLALVKSKNIKIIGLENDKIILNEILNNNIDKYEGEYNIIKKVTYNAINGKNDENKCINLIIGDAAIEIKKLENEYFDAIFFDAFSPSKQKELWSQEIFEHAYRVLKKGGILTTYSCAGWVKRNMISAGFSIKKGPAFGRRSGGTIAKKL